jgi:hypothetical protein
MTTPETLGVDPVSLSGFGNEMLSAAGDIPLAPPPFTTAGADPISLKIMSALPGIETPIQTGLPEIKAEATKTASDIVDAAAKYLQTDEQLAKAYENQQFDGQGGPSGGGGASGGGVPGAGAAAGGAGAGAQAAGGAGGMDQMGQLMSMPMQMAGQAAQLPMQAMGALGSIPQGVMQGVQQVSQMAGGLGGADSAQGDLEKSDAQDESPTRPDDSSKSDSGQDAAASDRADAERAPVEQSRPEAGPREESPAPAEEKKTPAQTRPAEVAQRMNL